MGREGKIISDCVNPLLFSGLEFEQISVRLDCLPEGGSMSTSAVKLMGCTEAIGLVVGSEDAH